MNSTAALDFDVLVIGAGAAGLMCAIAAGQRGRRVLVLDHANKVGKKILMSGGGRCNFTNMYSTPENFISANPHFMKSALSRYTPWDFIALVEKHSIPYHEKKLGQLFCDRSSKDIVRMLLDECTAAGAQVHTHCPVEILELGRPHRFSSPLGEMRCESIVVATGGYSIPKMGATGYGFDLARKLGMKVLPTRAALVPIVLNKRKQEQFEGLAGASLDTRTHADGPEFRENILFTHKGLSGPAILQASSYWQIGQPIHIDLFPDASITELIEQARSNRPAQSLKNFLAERLTRRIAERWCELWLENKPLGQLSRDDIQTIQVKCQPWSIWPSDTEGYRTAEVTLGGLDTDELSSQTLQSHKQAGLYFIGEVVDVTGHLGGHNFQWAWASGHAAGQFV
ncbi:MAG: NAD(P)/FAD-dependent oxidoreductase [Pseudomonadota bacterium]